MIKSDISGPKRKVNIIVQARMASTRLPGKVMREMNGQPMIGHLIDRMRRVMNADAVIYAIPREDVYGPLGEYLKAEKCVMSASPEDTRTDINDVAVAFAKAVHDFPCDAFVRVCADSPMLEPDGVSTVIMALRDGGPYVPALGFHGQQVQGIQTKLFLKYLPEFTDEEREHVLLYFDRKLSMTVDTEADFRRVERLMKVTDITEMLEASCPPRQ